MHDGRKARGVERLRHSEPRCDRRLHSGTIVLFMVAILALVMSLPCAHSGERVGNLKRNHKGKITIYDHLGKREGHLKKDSVAADRIDIYDKYGRRTGHLKGNLDSDERVVIYDKLGRRVGELKKDSAGKDKIYIHSRDGSRAGHMQLNRLIEGRTDIYREGDHRQLPHEY